MTKLKP